MSEIQKKMLRLSLKKHRFRRWKNKKTRKSKKRFNTTYGVCQRLPSDCLIL